MSAVATHLATALKHNPLLSLSRWDSTSALENWLGTDVTLIRAMPNTPAMVQAVPQGFMQIAL